MRFYENLKVKLVTWLRSFDWEDVEEFKLFSNSESYDALVTKLKGQISGIKEKDVSDFLDKSEIMNIIKDKFGFEVTESKVTLKRGDRISKVARHHILIPTTLTMEKFEKLRSNSTTQPKENVWILTLSYESMFIPHF